MTGCGEWMVAPQTKMGMQEEEQVGAVGRADSAGIMVNLKCLRDIGRR